MSEQHYAFYNDIEPYVLKWLRNLMQRGLITYGQTSRESITDLQSSDLAPYTRVHLFAGIGGWDYALRLAGWPEELPVWTGSCPCQPFSVAGKRQGVRDKRHLWPQFLRLIAERTPATVFGEQVSGKDGRAWLRGIRFDLEELGYRFAAVDLPACSVGAPHGRSRLYWVADRLNGGSQDGRAEDNGQTAERHVRDDRAKVEEFRATGGSMVNPSSNSNGRNRGILEKNAGSEKEQGTKSAYNGENGGSVAVPLRERPQRQQNGRATGILESVHEQEESRKRIGAYGTGDDHTLGVSNLTRPQGRGLQGRGRSGELTSGTPGHWSSYSIVQCLNPKPNGPILFRRVEPGTFPLAHGVSNRVGRIRAYGNSIVPQVAAQFIRSYMEAVGTVEVDSNDA